MVITSRRMKSRWAQAGACGTAFMTAAAAVALISAPGSAQSDESPFVVVSRTPTDTTVDPPTGGDPWSQVNRSPRMSDDGDVITFAATDPQGIDQVVIRVRSDDETVLVPDAGAANPAISGDGCVVTYSTFAGTAASGSTGDDDTDSPSTSQPEPEPPGDDADDPAGSDAAAPPQAAGAATIRLFDRCAAMNDPTVEPVELVTVPADAPLPPAAVAPGGAVVAVTTGDAIVRFDRGPDGRYTETARVGAATGLQSGEVVGDTVDISVDGSRIVFEAGPGTAPFEITEPSVRSLASGPNVAPVVEELSAGSRDPDMSADGQLIVYEVVTPAAPTDPTGVVVFNSGVNGSVPSIVPIDTDGVAAAIDPGGRHVVFEDTVGDEMVLVSWVGPGVDPFATVTRTNVSLLPDGASSIGRSLTGPRVSDLGRYVAFDSAAGAQLSDDARFAVGDHVWLRSIDVTGGGPLVDLGTGDVGDVLTGTVRITNDGPAGLAIPADGVTVDLPFLVDGTTCDTVLHPGESCVVDVSVEIEAFEQVAGVVRVGATDATAPALTAEVVATGEPSTTSSTRPVATTPNTTRTTIPPRSRTTTRNTTRRTTATTATTAAPAPVVFSPTSFDFAPTIVQAGRRDATVELVNPGTSAVTIVGVRVDPAGSEAFTVTATTCAGTSLGAGQTCTVDLAFEPVTEGALATTLIAEPSTGDQVQAAITGVGAPPPTLEVLPGVAAHQQVVAIRGAGFPAGAVVDLAVGELVQRTITIDDAGGFAETLVIMTSMPTGPVEVVVAGQAGLFADVRTSMLVSDSATAGNPAVLPGFGPDVSG